MPNPWWIITSIMDSRGKAKVKGREQNRGSDIERTLRLLAAMMRGEELDKTAAAKVARMKEASVSRNLKLLANVVPGVEVDASGPRHVYRFDMSAIAAAEAPDGKATLMAAIVMSLAAAFGRVFSGSQYRGEFIKLRDATIQRLAQSWKQRFSDMTRKFVVISGNEELLEDKEGLLDDVIDAVLKERRLELRYENFEGVPKTRTIEPYSFAVYDGHLYVLGADAEEGPRRVRTFRFARIRKAKVLPQTFIYPATNEYDLEVLLRDSIGIWQGAEDPVRVLIRLSPTWAVFASHHRWHGSQRVVGKLDDGSVDLELRVRVCPELEQWVLRFGEGAEVLEPSALRTKIGARLAAAAARYS